MKLVRTTALQVNYNQTFEVTDKTIAAFKNTLSEYELETIQEYYTDVEELIKNYKDELFDFCLDLYEKGTMKDITKYSENEETVDGYINEIEFESDHS